MQIWSINFSLIGKNCKLKCNGYKLSCVIYCKLSFSVNKCKFTHQIVHDFHRQMKVRKLAPAAS